jgi:sugar O-acyltransferase (sialic acid O-acetyltransferase NeuD family)
MLKKIYLIGGGGHCKSCIDVIESSGLFKINGIFDIPEKIGQEVLGYKIIDSDENIEKYADDNVCFIVTAGQIKSSALREKLFSLNLNYKTIISPRAHVSKHARVGKGTIVMHDALINAGAEIGENCIINSKALIEHDAKVGNHCHISTSAVINGDCVVGDRTFIGSNTVIKNGHHVDSNSVVPYGENI